MQTDEKTKARTVASPAFLGGTLQFIAVLVVLLGVYLMAGLAVALIVAGVLMFAGGVLAESGRI